MDNGSVGDGSRKKVGQIDKFWLRHPLSITCLDYASIPMDPTPLLFVYCLSIFSTTLKRPFDEF